jgi:diadenosine tetraphosphatase ApaH/serine/threonine PP2A family protein phosphatase
MKIAILSDIHANLPALQAVLEDVARTAPGAPIWHCGDVVGYGASPNEVVAELQRVGATGVMGNHDLAALGDDIIETFNEGAYAAALWTRDALTAESRSWLRALPKVLEMGSATLVHASLRDPIMEYVVEESVARESLQELATPLLFHGHTHIPAIWSMREGSASETEIGADPIALRGGSLVNAGSVGQPRDRDPRAAWLLWERDELGAGLGSATWRRVEYNIAAAQASITAAGLPASLADRLAEGR